MFPVAMIDALAGAALPGSVEAALAALNGARL
jgi:hypothetical protein